MSGRRNNQLPDNLPQLQNQLKRDPESYREEFMLQKRRFQSTLDLFKLRPHEPCLQLQQLTTFLAQVAHCYPEELSDLGPTLLELLTRHGPTLNPETRLGLVRSLVLLRNKGLVSPLETLPAFFHLLRCQDKGLRKFLQTHIVTDVKNTNAKQKNLRLNTSLQNFMYGMLTDTNTKAAKMSLHIMVELYHKNIWNDAKTVNVISMACLSKVTRLAVSALTFFLGSSEEKEDEDENDSDDDDLSRHVAMSTKVNKKSRSRKKQAEKIKEHLKKKKKSKKAQPTGANFGALYLIHDPQGFAEKLFRRLESMTERFEVRLLAMEVVARLIGIHQLFLLNFYPYLQRYMQPHQREVTRLLLFAAQASHELVPPESIHPLMRAIVDNFVTERNSGDVMSVGLNTIREICGRCPLAMDEALLQDLVQYRTSKDRSVVMAARSLLRMYRVTNPELLRKRDRGRPTIAGTERTVQQYGESTAKSYIPGAETIAEEEDLSDEQEGSEWETDEEDSDGSWVDVSHSDDEPEAEESAPKTQMTAEERSVVAKEVSSTRLLTDADFKKIETEQAKKEVEAVRRGSAKKRKANDTTDKPHSGDIVPMSAIEMVHKRRKDDFAARMASAMRGKEGRDKFGKQLKRQNPFASTSNKEKKKTKNFMMIKHKARKKQKRSFQDRQLALRNALLKQKRMTLK